MLKKVARAVIAVEWLVVALLLPAVIFVNPARFLALLVIPVLWAARKVAYGRFVPATPLNGPILGLLIMLLVSVFVTFDVAFSLAKIAGVIYGVAVFYATADAAGRSPRHLGAGVAVLLASGVAVGALGLLGVRWSDKMAALNAISSRLPQRLLSLPGATEGFNPNQVAGALLWVAPLAVVLSVGLVARSRAWRPPVVIVVAVMGAAIFMTVVLILTQSRSALLGYGAALFAMLLIGLRRYPRAQVGLTAAAVVIAIGLFNTAGLDRLLASSGDNVTEGAQIIHTLAGRREIWSRALYAIRDFPFTGVGMGAFRQVVPGLYPLFVISSDVDIAHAHNHLLQTALDLGLPGLAAYLAVWAVAAVMLWRSWQAAEAGPGRALAAGFGACLLAYFVYGLTDTVALGAKPGFIFWLLLGLVVALFNRPQINTD